MPRKLLLVALLLAAPLAARAAVSGGGDIEMIRSVYSAAGASYLSGGDLESASSVGEPAGSIPDSRNGVDMIVSGYLSGVVPVTTGTLQIQLVSTGSIVAGGMTLVLRPSDVVELQFAVPMAPLTLTDNVRVHTVMDSLGSPMFSSWTITAVYVSTAQSYLMRPVSGDWPNGALLEVTLSTGARDANGVPLASETYYAFTPPRDPTVLNIPALRPEPTLRVNVPAGAYTEPYFIAIASGIDSAAIRAASDRSAASGKERRPVKVAQIDSYDTSPRLNGGPDGGGVSIQIPIPDSNNDGVVDGNAYGVRSKTLGVWRLDETMSLWVKQPGTQNDASQRTLLQPTHHFSIYALIGKLDSEVSEAYAFPVPFRPGAGDPARYGTWADGIRFTNLPSAGTIDIYSVSGQRVRRMDINANPQTWDVRNSAGQTVASGLYIWEVRSGENAKRGKLLIIK